MDAASLFCIGLGILIMADRARMIVAPRAVLGWWQRTAFQTDTRARFFAGVLAAMAAGLILLDFGAGVIPSLFEAWGWLTAAVTLWGLLFPGPFRRFYNGAMDFFAHSVDDALLRGVGILGLLFGLWMIYFGVEVL